MLLTDVIHMCGWHQKRQSANSGLFASLTIDCNMQLLILCASLPCKLMALFKVNASHF